MRITNVKRFLRVILVSSFLPVLMGLSSPAWSAKDVFFDESFGNYQEELEVAKETGKKGIFMFFHMEECPFCHRMRSTIMTEPDVISLYKNNFLTFMFDIEGSQTVVDFDGTESTSKALAKNKYRVRATPVMMIFDTNGKPLVKYTGPTRTKEEFKWLAEYVLDGSYQTQSFTAYKRARKLAARE
ncbi:thioredoxin family protein [Thiomicrorhabdus arctica]|uniref:thioredoxin family protein n=1 Tax=Thiomicrorhabdus arctica TaxID=131540 RepID=UPI00037CF870|nr:thioredoxin fold domain-containing protein [Thiomicrorhabdus arctica]